EHEVFITIPQAARTVRLWVADSGALDAHCAAMLRPHSGRPRRVRRNTGETLANRERHPALAGC
ncbi:hypothetical protein ABZW18_29065, partial [Streptomyces sp. NPDC004647]|uniref:hypothetical protein n=1 Tax=Streptomyces sp. NPDC004647 TaxID=3154671 RepID=UPI0033AD443D